MKKKYIVDGKIYEVPDNESAAFLKDFPHAKVSYNVGGKDYEIPHQEADAFETDMGLKKKEQVTTNTLPTTSKDLSNGVKPSRPDFLQDPRTLVNQPKDNTFVDRPINALDVQNKLESNERHKENVKLAIDNTTKKALENKGLKVIKNSPIYNEQKAKLEKAYANGDVTYHSKDGVPGLDNKGSFLGNLVDGLKGALNENDEAAAFANNMTTQEKVDYVNKKKAEQPKSEFYEQRAGVGNLVGGAIPILAQAAAGATVGSALTATGVGTAALPAAMSFLFTNYDMMNHGAKNEILSRYESLKNQHPEMSDFDAMKKAESGGMVAGMLGGAAENALFNTQLKMPVSVESKNVIKQFLGSTVKSGVHMGAATTIAKAGQLAERKAEGYEVTSEEAKKELVGTFTDNLTNGMLLTAVLHAPNLISKLPGIVKSAFKRELIKNVPPQEIAETLDANVQEGVITPEMASKTAKDIEGYKDALSRTGDNLNPDAQASVAGLIQKKDNLKAEMETKDESQHEPYKAKIESIDNQIQEISRTNKPLEHEIDDLTGEPYKKPTFDEVAQERVEDLAQRISKGKPIEDAIDLQLQSNFPDKLEKELNKILKEENSKNKDKENPNTEISDEVSKYLKDNKKEEPTEQPKVDTPIQEEKVSEPTVSNEGGGVSEPKEYVSKTGRSKIVYENGNRKIIDVKTGEEVSKPTARKVLREAQENYDYTVGNKSPKEVPDFTDNKEHANWIVENSENPAEIATVFRNEEKEGQSLNTEEEMISEYGIGKVKASSYYEFGDRNNMNNSKARTYLSRDKNRPNDTRRSLDVIALEMSDHYGHEITPQDLVAFMDRFPNGESQATKLRDSEASINAQKKFEKLTGLPLNDRTADLAIKQEINKLSKQQQSLLNQDYETRQQFEEAYWKAYAETNGFTEGSVTTETKPTETTKETVNEQTKNELPKSTEEESNTVSQPDKISQEAKEAEPPIEPPKGEDVVSGEGEDWAAVRKEKLKEISGVKEMIEKRKPKGWTKTFQSAAENVQKMFPKKSLYEAMKARVQDLKLRMDSGELYNPTSEDNAVFTMLRAETDKRINDVEGQDSPNSVVRQAANMELENLHNDLMDIARVTNPEGETGRAFNILQSEAKFDADNGLKIRRMQLMKANGNEPLTTQEETWAKEQWEKEKEIIKQENEVKVKGMQEDFDNKISELQKEYEEKLKQKNKDTPQVRTAKSKTLGQKGKDIADQIRKLKIQKGDTALDVTMGLRNAAIEAVATLVEKGATIAEAIKKVLEDKKYEDLTEDELTGHILDGLNNKKDKATELEKIRSFAKENDVTDITQEMVKDNMIRDYVNSHIGEVEQSDILNTSFKDLKDVLPNITKERMLEAYLKENEFKQPTKKVLEGSITQAKKELSSIAKLEEDIKDLEGLKEIRQRSFPTERAKSEHEQKLFNEKNAKVKEITDRNNKIKADNARIEAERNRQLKKVDELRTKKEKLKQGIIEKTEARDRKLDTPEIEKLRTEVKQIEKDIRAAEAAQKAAERKVISDRNKSIKEGNRKVESEAIRQVSKVQELQAKKEALKNGIREKRSIIPKEDTHEIERMKAAVKEADANLRAAESEAKRLSKEIQDKKDKIGELDANIERAKNDRDLIKTHKNKTVPEIDEEIANKQKELKKAVKDNSSEERVQAKKLEDAKKNAIKQKEEFQRKLDEGEFEEPTPTKLKKKDADLIRLEKQKSIVEESYRKKQKELHEKNKHWVERAMDTIRSSYVALLIGHPLTLAKVASMSILRPLSEGVRKATLGKVFDSFFPNISKAALRGGESSSWRSIKKGYEAYFSHMNPKKLEEKYQKAESELDSAIKEYKDYKNTPNADEKKLSLLKDKVNDKLLKSTGSFIYKFIGGSSLKDSYTALVNRSNEIEKQFGKVESESMKDGNWLDKTNYIAGFIGRSHSAAKTFSGRFSFAAGFMARLEGAVRNGEDITSGDKILEIAHESYLDWERGKYQQSNAISDIWNKITNSISKGEEKGIRTVTAKAMEALLKGDVAITRVPVNILHEGIVEYTFGAIKAAYMGAKETMKARQDVKDMGIMPNEAEFKNALRERLSKMDEKQAATIFRCFTKGGLGIGLYALALISGGVHFGILPHLGQKKKKDEKDLEKGELNPGDIIIGGTRIDHNLAKIIEHIPALYPTAMGLGMAQEYKDQIDKGKTTKGAVAKSIFTHLQIIEGSVPQTQIISPTRVATKISAIVEKRLTDLGVIGDKENIFTKTEQDSPIIKSYIDKGIKFTTPIQAQHKVDIDDKHPKGIMTPDEFTKFKEYQKEALMKGIPERVIGDKGVKGLNGILNTYYSVDITDANGNIVEQKQVLGKDLDKEELKSRVEALTQAATKYANIKMKLKKDAKITKTVKEIE